MFAVLCYVLFIYQCRKNEKREKNKIDNTRLRGKLIKYVSRKHEIFLVHN